MANELICEQPISEKQLDVNWCDCTLRSYFNGYGPSANRERKDYSADTTDKIFIISYKDSINPRYGFCSYNNRKSATRVIKTTKYYNSIVVENPGLGDLFLNNAQWGMRSNGEHSGTFVIGSVNGMIDMYGAACKTVIGEAPALTIDLSKGAWKSYKDSGSGSGGGASILKVYKDPYADDCTGPNCSNNNASCADDNNCPDSSTSNNPYSGLSSDETLAFVERMYTVALGRDYDTAGRDQWAWLLTSGEILYQTFMDRSSDPSGKTD